MAFLQTDFIHAKVRDHTLRIDRHDLVVGQLVLDDETHGFRGDAESPRHLGLVGTDEHLQHPFLKAKGVCRLFAFERRQPVVAMMAFGAAMENGLVTEERGLAENIEIADDAHFALVEMGFPTCRPDGFTTGTATRIGQRPSDFDAVRFGEAMITGDGDAIRQIDVDGEVGHYRPWQKWKASRTPCRPRSCDQCRDRPDAEKTHGTKDLHLKAEEP